MNCPYCRKDNDKVTDTRLSDDGFVIRRRRLCCFCGKKFTTYERIETRQVRVIKRNGDCEPFDRDKIKRGLQNACWKRPIDEDQIVSMIAQVEADIEGEDEVESDFIGERVIKYLGELDQVAYVRFASVYRHFQDVSDFADEIDAILGTDSDFPDNRKLPQELRFTKHKKKQ